MVAQGKCRLVVVGALGAAGLLACVLAAIAVWRGSSVGARRYADLEGLDDDSSSTELDGDAESRIVAFCSDCHPMPSANGFPRQRWHHEVRKGYEYYARSGRNDLDPPPMHLTLTYFRSRAPKELAFPSPEDAPTDLRATFAVENLDWDRRADVGPAIACLRWSRIDADGAPLLLACDMRDGSVAAVDLRSARARPRVLARLSQPCHVEPSDLDGNGTIDLVVADLGSFSAVDHDRGRVVWLRRPVAAGSFEEVVLASGLGRVADARPADFDADGDLDLIVAEFGHYRTGGIHLLRNVAAAGESPHFERQEIDPRPGTIHLPVHDFNHDGRPDFVALVSQEYEAVDLFVNQGDAAFNRCNLWAGPDLTFGSSGIELADLDQDGDLDVLYTNGDTFDNSCANASHGVQWLENLGDLRFAYHRLADLTGAYRALAGDVDLDGDLDVIVVAWLPRQIKPHSLRSAPLATVLCMEQTSPRCFVRHTLKTGLPRYATLEMADFDNDGDIDFAVGAQQDLQEKSPPTVPPIAVWWNQVISAAE